MNEVMGKYRNVYAIGFSLPIWGNGRNGYIQILTVIKENQQ